MALMFKQRIKYINNGITTKINKFSYGNNHNNHKLTRYQIWVIIIK